MSEQNRKRALPGRFVLAVTVGGVIGLGILRGPGEIAAVVTEPGLYLLFWISGGLFIFRAQYENYSRYIGCRNYFPIKGKFSTPAKKRIDKNATLCHLCLRSVPDAACPNRNRMLTQIPNEDDYPQNIMLRQYITVRSFVL